MADVRRYSRGNVNVCNSSMCSLYINLAVRCVICLCIQVVNNMKKFTVFGDKEKRRSSGENCLGGEIIAGARSKVPDTDVSVASKHKWKRKSWMTPLPHTAIFINCDRMVQMSTEIRIQSLLKFSTDRSCLKHCVVCSI